MDKKPSVSLCETLPQSYTSLSEDTCSSGDQKRKTSEAILRIQKLKMIDKIEVQNNSDNSLSKAYSLDTSFNGKVESSSSWGSSTWH